MTQIWDMGQDGFYFPSEEGVLSIFSPWKIRRLRLVLNPRTWVPKAITLHLDHRSRFSLVFIIPPKLRTHLYRHAVSSEGQVTGAFRKAMLLRMSGGIRMNTVFEYWVLIVKDLNEWPVRVLNRFTLLRVECSSGLWWTLKLNVVSKAAKTLTDY
jgi:hypothetical protein